MQNVVCNKLWFSYHSKYYEKVGPNTLDISEDIPFDIPDSWTWSRLGNLFYNATGLAYSKDSLDVKSAKPIRVLRGGNILEGKWEIKADDVFIAPEFVNEKLLLRKGTFITPAVTSLERMGKTALIREDLNDTVVGGFVLMLLPFMIDDALLEYMLLFFQTIYYKQYCISITNKSGQAFYNLSRTKLMQCLVPVPPEAEVARIRDFYYNHIANTMRK